MRAYALDRYKEAIDLSAEWECPYVVTIPGPVNSLINPPHDWMLNWFVEGMHELVGYCKGTGVQLLLESVPFTYLPTVQDMIDTANLIGSEIGVNYDVGSGAFIKEDPADAIRLLSDMCKNLHVSDSDFDEFKHERLGIGIIDSAPVAKALEDIGCDGVTILEIITDALVPGADPDADIIASHEILASNGWKGWG